MGIKNLLARLESAARRGQQEIEAGDPFRHQLPDRQFSQLIPHDKEDAVLETMIASGRWHRGSYGFDLLDWTDELEEPRTN